MKFWLHQDLGDHLVLVEQYFLVKANVGDAYRAVIPQCSVVSKNRNLMKGVLAGRVEAPVAIVIADRIGGGQQAEPACVQQGVEPGQVLAAGGDGAADCQGHGHALADGLLQKLVHAPEVGPPKTRKAFQQELIQVPSLGDRTVNEFRGGGRTASALVMSGGAHGPLSVLRDPYWVQEAQSGLRLGAFTADGGGAGCVARYLFTDDLQLSP